ncbi:TraR/DksA C4-type zinc finger protein [Sporosarcina sp. G11-34]|uniref:TraR/DksA C4-type zinc finger protein n=1 Tax=Sporosarcina sp. G11-34 TaxID=2849605 RepID=UPI0022A8DAD7|nr:TraR/DksA C4-type zinc finger protein [Sporosarcina sp. G11-34]MCZ2257685.1 TraR/DksA C4-type zinc finger protein [Sporosarcina sp. G11-34]
MLSTTQLSKLKKDLLEMKMDLSKTEEETTIKENSQEASGELSMYANHPGDMGTELFEREKDMALHVHAGSELEKVENALQAIVSKSYGKCEVCQREIPFERLEAIPYTTFCMEHSMEHSEQNLIRDRPVEEEILIPAKPDSFADRRHGVARDAEDSFQEAAKSGTSETPSDFTGDHDSYAGLYDNNIEDGATEKYEEFAATDITGESHGFLRSDESEKYEAELDDKSIQSPLGDIPYHEGDSYVDRD